MYFESKLHENIANVTKLITFFAGMFRCIFPPFPERPEPFHQPAEEPPEQLRGAEDRLAARRRPRGRQDVRRREESRAQRGEEDQVSLGRESEASFLKA
jgi:hypothetical protein